MAGFSHRRRVAQWESEDAGGCFAAGWGDSQMLVRWNNNMGGWGLGVWWGCILVVSCYLLWPCEAVTSFFLWFLDLSFGCFSTFWFLNWTRRRSSTKSWYSQFYSKKFSGTAEKQVWLDDMQELWMLWVFWTTIILLNRSTDVSTPKKGVGSG